MGEDADHRACSDRADAAAKVDGASRRKYPTRERFQGPRRRQFIPKYSRPGEPGKAWFGSSNCVTSPSLALRTTTHLPARASRGIHPNRLTAIVFCVPDPVFGAPGWATAPSPNTCTSIGPLSYDISLSSPDRKSWRTFSLVIILPEVPRVAQSSAKIGLSLSISTATIRSPYPVCPSLCVIHLHVDCVAKSRENDWFRGFSCKTVVPGTPGAPLENEPLRSERAVVYFLSRMKCPVTVLSCS